MRKKMLLFVGAAAISSGIAAQVRIGVHTGGNLSNAAYTSPVGSYTSSQLAGFNAGITTDLDLTPEIHAFIQLQYIQKGSKFSFEQTTTAPLIKNVTKADITQPVNFIQLPLNITYQFDLGKSAHFFVGAGPSFSYALKGKTTRKGTNTTTVTILGVPTTTTAPIDEAGNLKIGSEASDDLKPFEFGINGIAGIKLDNGFALSANYTYGLNNQATQENLSYKARSFGASLHYFFNANNDK